MAPRYHLREGIVVRRSELPSGDVVVTVLGSGGKWRGVARKGKLLGGNLARLSLFHEVSVQGYRKRDDDLLLITQVELSGALPALSQPALYPYAHLLAELAEQLAVDQAGERLYAYLASGLRGLVQHHDPEAVALIISWRLVQQAGLAPRLTRCARCGGGPCRRFDIAAGGLTCDRCASGLPIAEAVQAELLAMLTKAARETLSEPLLERPTHWALLSRYLAFHVGSLNSLGHLGAVTSWPPSS